MKQVGNFVYNNSSWNMWLSVTFFYPNLKHAQTVYTSIRRYTWSARCTKCLFCDSTGFRPLLPILVFILSLNWCNVKTFFNLTTYGRVLMIQFLKCSKQLTLQKLSFFTGRTFVFTSFLLGRYFCCVSAILWHNSTCFYISFMI